MQEYKLKYIRYDICFNNPLNFIVIIPKVMFPTPKKKHSSYPKCLIIPLLLHLQMV